MSALTLYCATSMLHVGLPHRHAPDLIDMVMPVSHLTGGCHLHYVWHNTAFSTYLDYGWRLVRRLVGRFSSKFRPKLWISFFSSKMQNFAISFVFRPERISCVHNNMAFPRHLNLAWYFFSFIPPTLPFWSSPVVSHGAFVCWQHSTMWLQFAVVSCHLQIQMLACIDDIAGWMSLSRLQLNTAKTEIPWCTSPHWQSTLLFF